MTKNILDLRGEEKIQSEFNLYAKSVLNDEIRLYIIENAVEYCESEDMSFLPDEGVIESLIVLFKKYYTAIKLFHGCKPIDVEDYYTKGILVQDSERLYKLASEIFSDVNEEELSRAFGKTKESHREEGSEGSVFFTFSKNELVKKGGHFLIKGSEFIQALAIEINDSKVNLREIGIPTIFEVNIPISFIPNEKIKKDVICPLLANWGNQLLKNDPEETNAGYQTCFEIKQPIDPSYIVSHYHPDEIVDPLPDNHRGIYRSKITSCEVCEK
ncbi:MAG: hypothetical protein K9L79_11730 [Methylobacter tundripaludum]|nr:hypothetical protein [Methylobacter tundripaludum]